MSLLSLIMSHNEKSSNVESQKLLKAAGFRFWVFLKYNFLLSLSDCVSLLKS